MKTLLCLALVITLTISTNPQPEFTNTETTTLKPYFSTGHKYWVEMLIGFSIAAPISYAKLWLPNECGKVISLMTNDIGEQIIFWRELLMNQEGWLVVNRDDDFDTYIVNRNAYYLMIDNLSVVGSIPKLINACFLKDQVGKVQALETLEDFINADFL